jgi:hypothetical protein
VTGLFGASLGTPTFTDNAISEAPVTVGTSGAATTRAVRQRSLRR